MNLPAIDSLKASQRLTHARIDPGALYARLCRITGPSQAPATERSKGMEINIGIAEQDRAAIAEGLSRLLADTYTLYLKTHNFH